MELVSQNRTNVRTACRLFGHCHQAYYQFKSDFQEERHKEAEIVQSVKEIREEDPGIGAFKLFLMIAVLFGKDCMPGRDAFFRILRKNKLMLKRPRPRHTTNSNHRFHKYKNMVRGFTPDAANQMWVSDITYIDLDTGPCYLHLITDAYSHKIVGWRLSDSLKASVSIEALNDAVAQAGGGDLVGLVHHSDRGIQYCCDAYVDVLRAHNITISMTEDYKPTDNAIAERVNGIIKMERVYKRHRFSDIDEARSVIGRFIVFYNDVRPHMSIGYKTPSQVHDESGPQKKMWNPKIYPSKNSKSAEKDVTLPAEKKKGR